MEAEEALPAEAEAEEAFPVEEEAEEAFPVEEEEAAGSPAEPRPRRSIDAGDAVEARWRGGDRWYPGLVVRRAGDALDVRYDDGDEERGVPRPLARPLAPRRGGARAAAPSAAPSPPRRGDARATTLRISGGASLRFGSPRDSACGPAVL